MRGTLATEAAKEAKTPVEFGEMENLKWKTEIPGKGHATPLVWGNNIIIQIAVASDEKNEAEENTEVRLRILPAPMAILFMLILVRAGYFVSILRVKRFYKTINRTLLRLRKPC